MYHGEKFNSISHLVGAVLAVMGFGALLTVSIQQNTFASIVSFTVFGLTLMLMYTASTLYHSFHSPNLKRFFQKLDHVAIYLLIAGTYTPYMMVSLSEGNGPMMLAIVWGLAVVGLILDTLITKRIKALQIVIYLLMGWVCVFEFNHLQEAIAQPGIALLVIGGIAYTVGVVFYVLDHKKKLNHAHGIWHLFVLVGSACHFVSIIVYVR
ncbi:hemolysin III family protein [Oceanicoccus sp. KOV_DT_Chl]|uniref:PAQR family membrane homeostasis protein TrhA n=1 Tax=Oceanicoccus sp. KOV_DT_Chl TaxID=1904639 RepID=UPI000C799ECE|nr:hemolysin III family protein [Oceanicoccus sp. KOV_DT_Chl]